MHLIERLHRVFHLVTVRRAANRYDVHFTDDPTSFLRERKAAQVSTSSTGSS
jgi:hypothetical protein